MLEGARKSLFRKEFIVAATLRDGCTFPGPLHDLITSDKKVVTQSSRLSDVKPDCLRSKTVCRGDLIS